MQATFTDRELEYIYAYLELDVNRKLVYSIEKKIRYQIKRYRDIDEGRG